MLLLLLSCCPRKGRLRRASLLPLLAAAVLLCLVPVSGGLPAAHKCPRHIDCAREGRQLCRPGSSHCGPCLDPLQETQDGRCVEKRSHRQHVTFYPDLDEEIDFLQSVIEKQEVTEMKAPPKQSKSLAASSSQTDVKHTDAPEPERRNQTHPSSDGGVTTAPGSALSDPPTPQPRTTGDESRAHPLLSPVPKEDLVMFVLISLCVIVGTVAVVVGTVCYVKMQKGARLAEKVDYPAFGATGKPVAPVTGSSSVGDNTLAQNAQMYHYQHQKQQMLSMGSHKPEQKVPDNEETSDEEEVGGDFTVYECPGLAPTGEMEVKNPLFDDSTLQYQGAPN